MKSSPLPAPAPPIGLAEYFTRADRDRLNRIERLLVDLWRRHRDPKVACPECFGHGVRPAGCPTCGVLPAGSGG